MSGLEQQIDVDYYKVLGVPHTATLQQICAHYRDIALASHPALQHTNPNAAYQRFSQAAEAFDVLHDAEKRQIYDKHGEQQLKEGVLQDGALLGKYRLTTDPEETFEKFFGTRNVFEHLLGVGGPGESHPIFKAQYANTSEDYRVGNLVVPVHCSLTELFNGCTKTLTYDKKVLTKDGKNAEFVKETRAVLIAPGDSPKTPLVFPAQGNSEPGYKQSPLVFSIVEVPEKSFRRDGDNLIYTASVSLMEALDSRSVTIKELNGELVTLHFDEIISPQTRRVIASRGMPHRADPSKRGDLIVKFDIQFPEELPLEKKRRIVELLRASQ